MLSGDERHRDAILLELPGREPRALEEGPRLARDDLYALARLDGGADDAERGPVARGRERARVAVGHDRRAVLDELGAVAAERPVHGDVLLVNRERLALEERAQRVGRAVLVPREHLPHPLDGPEEVHRRRPRGGEGAAEAIELARRVAPQGAGAERDAHRGRDADGGCAANDHVLDGARDLAMIAVDPIHLARRQQTLVDHDHASVPPFDRPHRHGDALARRASIPQSSPRQQHEPRSRPSHLDLAHEAPLWSTKRERVRRLLHGYRRRLRRRLLRRPHRLPRRIPSGRPRSPSAAWSSAIPTGSHGKVAFALDMMIRTVRYTLEYTYDPPRGARWRLVEGDIKSVEGSYRFDPAGDGTEATCSQSVDIGFWIPGPIRRMAEAKALRDSVEEFRKAVETRNGMA
jgi:hypothetical protein